jgi:MoaA/NifB/PqqE/SkfB family radical SAM enzyme
MPARIAGRGDRPEHGAGAGRRAPRARALEESGAHALDAFPGSTALLLLVEGCDLRCVFCRAPGRARGARPPTTAEAVALIGRAPRPRSGGRLIITGGEPTARDDLPGLLGAARGRFREVQLQTHGGRLARDRYARMLGDAGLTAVEVPLYAASAAAHDAVTGVRGSFARVLAGVEAARAAGLEVAVHTTVFASTLGEVAGVIGLVRSAGLMRLGLEPVGLIDTLAAYGRETPRLPALGAALADALRGAGRDLEVRLVAVPPCALPTAQGRRPELWHVRRSWRTGAVPAGYAEMLGAVTGGASRAFAAACVRCGLRHLCAGVAAEYLAAFGPGALPVRPLERGGRA